MGRADDNDRKGEAAQPPVDDDGRPGRVVIDNRGRNVWQWARDVIDSTSVLLKRLDNKDLALEPTQKVAALRPGQQQPAKAGAASKSTRRVELGLAETPRDKGGGFDPYNSR